MPDLQDGDIGGLAVVNGLRQLEYQFLILHVFLPFLLFFIAFSLQIQFEFQIRFMF
jgi:hypothetical protein